MRERRHARTHESKHCAEGWRVVVVQQGVLTVSFRERACVEECVLVNIRARVHTFFFQMYAGVPQSKKTQNTYA